MKVTLMNATAAAAVALATWAVFIVAQSDKALTEVPTRIGVESAPSVVPSNITVPVRLNHTALTELANELIPPTVAIPDQRVFHDESWTKNPFNGNKIVLWSITINGFGKVERTSPVTVVAEDDGLVMSTTIHASFTAHKHGVTETAQADARVSVKIVLDVNSEWEPVVRVTPTYSWIRRPVARLFGLFDLSLGSVSEKALDKQIGRLQHELPALVRKSLPLKEAITSAWNKAHFVAPLGAGQNAWLSVDPVSAHLLPPTAVDNDLLLNIGLVANLALSTDKPATPESEALPALSRTPPESSGFTIALPISAGYETLEKMLAASLVKESIKVPTPAGDVDIKIQDVTIYPSAPRLVIGTKVDMDLPDRWFDTKGWIYLFADPEFDAAHKVLRLKNVSFARWVDNKLVRVATAAFASQIEGEFQQRASIDLSKPLDEAVAKANALLVDDLQERIRQEAAEIEGSAGSVVAQTNVAAKIDGLSSLSFAFEEEKLTLVPVVSGSLSVELQPRLQGEEIRVANNGSPSPGQ